MKKIRALFSTLVLLVVLVLPAFVVVPQARAVNACPSVVYNPDPPRRDQDFTVSFELPAHLFQNGNRFALRMRSNSGSVGGTGWDNGGLTDINVTDHVVSRRFTAGTVQSDSTTLQFMVVFIPNGGSEQDYCTATSPTMPIPSGAAPVCTSAFVTVPATARLGVATTLTFNSSAGLQNFVDGLYGVKLNDTPICTVSWAGGSGGGCTTETVTFTQPVNYLQLFGLGGTLYCTKVITVDENSAVITDGVATDVGSFELCKQIPDGPQQVSCEECNGRQGIWTAVGCIKRDPKGIVQSALQIGLGIAGGVALLMILSAAFLFSTSQGDVKRTTEARELMSSAVIGLLFIIFSITILQFIGVTIFHIPGFGDG